MTSKKAIREKDSAKEIEKPWPEQLDKKEFSGRRYLLCQMLQGG